MVQNLKNANAQECDLVSKVIVQLSKLGETDSYYQLLVLDATTPATNSTHYSLFTVSVTSSSFHIELYELYWRIFKLNPIITTDPDLSVISCGGG